MRYAQIKNQTVLNVIRLDDESLLGDFIQNYDQCVRIDNLNPEPGIGWSYDGVNWSEPVPPPEE